MMKLKRTLVPLALIASVVTMTPAIFAQFECDRSGPPDVRIGSIGAGDPVQTSRVFRDGLPSSCVGGIPTAAPVTGNYRYDVYGFVNPTGADACVKVLLDASGCGASVNNAAQINAYSSFNPAMVMSGLIGKPGFSTVQTGSMSFPVAAGASFQVVVHEVNANGGCASYSIAVTYNTSCRGSGFDRANDGSSDLVVWRPSNGTWYSTTTGGVFNAIPFGVSSDLIEAGDYTGNNATDYAVYRPATSTAYYGNNPNTPGTNFTGVQWGTAGDMNAPADYDGDGKTDVAVWRPSNGIWYILQSADNTVASFNWGKVGDTPVWGDYDGDLKGDLGVIRQSGASIQWLVLQSNFQYGFVLGCPTAFPICGGGVIFGSVGDRPVPGDFDGDGKTDVAVWRPSSGIWYYYQSSTATLGNTPGTTNGIVAYPWGAIGDIPQPADFDGDRKTDLAVFRPSADPNQNFWYIRNSQGGTFTAIEWGSPGDQPASAPYRIQ